MGRETSAASRISSRAMITQGDKYRKHKCLPSSSFPCALTSFPCALTISHILWYGTSFWSVWVPVLALSPPSFWWTGSLLSRRADWEEENLHSVKALPRKSPNHCFPPRSKVQLLGAAVKKIHCIPARSSTMNHWTFDWTFYVLICTEIKQCSIIWHGMTLNAMNEEQVMFESARFQFPKNEKKKKKERREWKNIYITNMYIYFICNRIW